MAVNFGLVSNHPIRKRGRKSFFSPEGKVVLMFLKMYTQQSAPKLLEQLNGNVHYQIFCDVYVNPLCPLTNCIRRIGSCCGNALGSHIV